MGNDLHFAGCLYAAAPWANLTGAPLCALEHLQALRPHFDDVCLVLPDAGDLEGRAATAQIPQWRSPLVFRGLRTGGVGRLLCGLGPVVRSRWAYMRGLVRRLRERPGLLHVHSRAPHLPYALLAGRLARVPVVVTIHEPWTSGAEAWFDALLIRGLADRVVFPAVAVADAYPGFLRRRAVVTRYFSASQPSAPLRSAAALAQIGLPARLGSRKGVDVFLETCRRLRADGVAFGAWMGGGGWNSEEERQSAADFVARHGLAGVVADMDLVPSLEPLYARTDVVMLPSRRDPLPRVVMEAMVRGIPVVASRVDGIPDMVADGETGFLVEPEDAAGFAAATARLLADPELRARMGAAGRERARQLFSQDAYVAAMLELYRGLPLPRRDAGEGASA